MSGIVGIVRLDGDDADDGDLADATAKLDHRGGDDSGFATDGIAGLGLQRRYTTPEEVHEDTPVETERYLLTADARVDNRTELRRELDLDTDDVVTDADLIIGAYDRWGRRCPERLVGAYAFALWDREAQRLFCARDHAGFKPFYYAETDDIFTFASECGPLLESEEVSDGIDEIAVGDFLVGFAKDEGRTFHTDIQRLPPAHSAVVGTDRIEFDQYWSLDPSRELPPATPEEYVSGFRERFKEAVRCRLRRPGDREVGSTLSGGLDSSSIACTANDLLDYPLPTFSLVFDEVSESDESEYIRAVLDAGTFDDHDVHGDAHSPMEDLDEMLERVRAPFIANNLFLHWELYRSAEANDVPILLDGFGGDQAVSHGMERLTDLARSGQPLKLFQESRWYAERFDRDLSRVLFEEVASPLAPGPVRHIWRHLVTTTDPVARHSDVVDPGFAERIGLDERIRSFEEPPASDPRTRHYQRVTSGLESHNFELADVCAATFGVEPRYPFYDRRLMEYCLALPARVKLRDGWRRWVLRAAMAGTVPPAVRNRTTKGNLGVVFFEKLRSEDSEKLRNPVKNCEDLTTYVDVTEFDYQLWKFVDGDEGGRTLANVWRPGLLGYWLSQKQD